MNALMQINTRFEACGYEAALPNLGDTAMAESGLTTETPHEQSERGCGCKSSREVGSSAREILDRRYASGEINREQYEQMKQDLGHTKEVLGSAKNKRGCC
jgi:hypothetical protein